MDSEANIRESAPEPNPSPDVAPAPRPSRGLRFRLTTMLALVAAAASATALYAAWAEFNPDPDAPITWLLTVVLTGLAIGALRRASPVWVMLQIALACAGLRLTGEVQGTRLGNYVVLALFAATVVVPLLIVRALESSGREGRWRERVAAVAAVLLNTGLNLVAHVAFLFAANEIGMMPIQISAPGLPMYAAPIPPAPPIGFSSSPIPSPTGPAPADAGPLVPNNADAPPLMPNELQPGPAELGSDPFSMTPVPAPAPAPAPKSK